MKFSILTQFPAMFPGVLEESIMKRASENGILEFPYTTSETIQATSTVRQTTLRSEAAREWL